MPPSKLKKLRKKSGQSDRARAAARRRQQALAVADAPQVPGMAPVQNAPVAGNVPLSDHMTADERNRRRNGRPYGQLSQREKNAFAASRAFEQREAATRAQAARDQVARKHKRKRTDHRAAQPHDARQNTYSSSGRTREAFDDGLTDDDEDMANFVVDDEDRRGRGATLAELVGTGRSREIRGKKKPPKRRKYKIDADGNAVDPRYE